MAYSGHELLSLIDIGFYDFSTFCVSPSFFYVEVKLDFPDFVLTFFALVTDFDRIFLVELRLLSKSENRVAYAFVSYKYLVRIVSIFGECMESYAVQSSSSYSSCPLNSLVLKSAIYISSVLVAAETFGFEFFSLLIASSKLC